MPEPYIDTSGVVIPSDLTGHLVPVSEIAPNSWNPNHMEGFMRAKLVKAIKSDGFILPILVRPELRPEKIAQGIKWEIVDGEHRWSVAESELGMGMVPVLDLGSISDHDAQAITVKANSLKGDFDSVQLAGLIKNLADGIGRDAVVDALPYTPERIQSLMDLTSVSSDSLSGLLADTAAATAPEPIPGSSEGPGSRDEFKSFDGAKIILDHKCPRCGLEFNDKE